MPPVASDHHGGRGAGWMDSVTPPSQRTCAAVAVGGLVCRTSECRPATASITNRRRPVFKKKSGFNITINRRRLAAAADPSTCEFYLLQHRHRRLADADSPMFHQAPMSPIFDVRCVHRPNSSSERPLRHSILTNLHEHSVLLHRATSLPGRIQHNIK